MFFRTYHHFIIIIITHDTLYASPERNCGKAKHAKQATVAHGQVVGSDYWQRLVNMVLIKLLLLLELFIYY